MTKPAARTVAASGCLALLGMSVWWLVHPPRWLDGSGWNVLMALAWLTFGAGLWLMRRVPVKPAVVLIVLAGVGLPLAAGFAPPRSSDDLYRYIWDGRVQAESINPYWRVPASAELEPLREGFLWPSHPTNWCVPADSPHPAGCTLINRPTVHTIYPPVAQAYFVTVHVLSPPGARERPIQLAAALVAATLTVLLVLAFPRLGLDPRLAAVWAWCPFVALEAGNNAHVDVVAAFLGAVALLYAGLRRFVLSGAFLGLAVATKLTPILLGPSLVRRRPAMVAMAAASAIAVVYLPHVLAVGSKVVGFLPDYLNDEGYTTGGRFALLTLVMPRAVAPFAAVLVLAAFAIILWLRADPDRPWESATVLTGIALLIATPGYSWYALLLVMLIAFSGRFEYLVVVLAGYLAQYSSNVDLGGTTAQRIGYGTAALAIGVVALWRIRLLPQRKELVP